jgi:hypothetical protein
MARPSKLTPAITKRIGDSVSLGLTYALAAESAGITYQTLNQWMQRGKNSNTLSFINLLKNAMQMRQRNVLNGLMKQQKQETVKFVCGSWRDGSVKTSAGGCLGKQMLYLRIRM